MATTFGQIQEIVVMVDGCGMPLAVVQKGRQHKVIRIHEHWRIADAWWGDEVKRNYFKIETAQGVSDIYHDTLAERWYVAKGHT